MPETHHPSGWRTSARCSNSHCVEINLGPSTVGIRDSKNRAAGELWIAPESWTSFARRMRTDAYRD